MLRRVAPLLAVVAVAVLSSATAWFEPVRWTPDGFFYHARIVMLHGASEEEAVHEVLSGPLVADARSYTDSTQLERLRDAEWVEHTTAITRRRLFVPLLGAAVYPLAGDASLRFVSVGGYVAFVALVFLLLRRRYSVAASGAVACVVALLPELREWSFAPLTDSWGLALQTGALLAAALVAERGARWLPLWAIALLALSLTRDSAAVAVAAALWLFVRERTRVTALLAVVGLAAALPVPLLLGAPVGGTLGHNASDPAAYWATLAETIRIDVVGELSAAHVLPALAIVAGLLGSVSSQRAGAFASVARVSALFLGVTLAAGAVLATRDVEPVQAVPTGLVLVVGLGLLLVPSGRRDPYLHLMRAAAVASLLYVAVWPVPSGLRLLLPLLPAAAVGFARALDLRATPAPSPARGVAADVARA